jgi:hypothetical protein
MPARAATVTHPDNHERSRHLAPRHRGEDRRVLYQPNFDQKRAHKLGYKFSATQTKPAYRAMLLRTMLRKALRYAHHAGSNPDTMLSPRRRTWFV